MRRPRWLPALGLLASVALVWSVTAGVLWQADAAAALLDEKYSGAERLIFYRVEPGGVLRLQVPAGAEALRVVSHLVIPGDAPWSADRQHLYGLGLRLSTEEGGLLAEGPLFTRTRQSKAEQWGQTWLKEAAFSADAKTQLGDEREFILKLPDGHRESQTHVEVRYPGTEGAVLLRVYARFDRRRSALQLREATRLRNADARAQRATFLWWDKLDDEARQRLLDETWERLDPRGDPGAEFATEPVYRTDFRLSYADVEDPEKERLGEGRAVALNVMGPARLDVWLWKEASLDRTPPGPVAVSTLSLHGVEQRWEVPVPTGEPARHSLEIPAGVHTLTLQNAGAVDLRFTVHGPRWAQLGAAEHHVAESGSQGPALPWLPDLRRTDGYAAGPGCDALELELPEDADELARLLRLDARLLAPNRAEVAAPAGAEAPTVFVELLDARGQQVGEAAFGVEAAAVAAAAEDPFESAVGPPRAGEEVPCAGAPVDLTAAGTVELNARPLPLGQPLSARLFAPPTARTLRIRASAPALLSLYAYLPTPKGAQLEPPYAGHASDATRWRNAPYQQSLWHALRPQNHRALSELGAALTLISQVRLDRRGPSEPTYPSGTPVTLYPAGAPMSREMLEPELAHGEDERPGDPLRGVFTRLHPNRAVRIRFEGRTPQRPELRLDADDLAALGGDVRVLVDGKQVKRLKLRSARMRALLPPVRPGVRELVVETQAPGVTATLNRAPAPDARTQALRMRNVYRVGDGLRVAVRKKGPGATTLNIVVYTQDPQPSLGAALKVTIDRGKPKRATGVLVPSLTRGVRHLPFSSSDKPEATMTGAHKGRWFARTVPVTLGEDLAPGVHWVEVRPHRFEGPLWARFFVYDGESTPEPPKRWSRPGWDAEDAP